jgi:hypothetical protein
MSLSCRETVARLWAFYDDALSTADRLAVTRHLGECVECRSHFDHTADFLAVLRGGGGLGAHDAEAALASRVVTALASEVSNGSAD